MNFVPVSGNYCLYRRGQGLHWMHAQEQKNLGAKFRGVSCKCTPPGEREVKIYEKIFTGRGRVGVCEWLI